MHGSGGDWSTPKRSSKSKKKLRHCWASRWRRQTATTSHDGSSCCPGADTGLTASACAALNVSRASVYRQRVRLARPLAVRCPRPSPQRALTVVERQTVLDLLRAPRFSDQAPAEVYASLLDEGVYHCSIRTMYRILVPSRIMPFSHAFSFGMRSK